MQSALIVHVHLAPCQFVFTGRAPPRPPRFPYTTLFRSPPATTSSRPRPRTREGSSRRGCAAWSRRCGRRGRSESTRLNSSHTVISYAVFCLKKKNKQDLNRPQYYTHH